MGGGEVNGKEELRAVLIEEGCESILDLNYEA